jgi:hypothetical protein
MELVAAEPLGIERRGSAIVRRKKIAAGPTLTARAGALLGRRQAILAAARCKSARNNGDEPQDSRCADASNQRSHRARR